MAEEKLSQQQKIATITAGCVSLANAIMPIFEGLFQPTTRRLIQLKKAGATDYLSSGDWQEKAVRTIIKNLKNTAVDELERIIGTEATSSPCITVPRNIEGDPAFELNGVKVSPPMVACQFWRWPALMIMHELRSSNSCVVAASNSQDVYCVNPFHYERVLSPDLPPVMVPRGIIADVPMTSRATTDHSTTSITHLMPSISADFVANIVPNDLSISEDIMDVQTMDGAGTSSMGTGAPDGGAGNGASSQLFDGAGNMSFTPGGIQLQPVMFMEPDYWCQIIYYELAKQVGIFNAKPRAITIDGYVDPSNNDRMCLGHYSNPERTPRVEDTRRHIGRGVRLWYIGGEVFVECISQCAIWVQSQICNKVYGWPPMTVVKVPPGCNLKVFSNQEFARTLSAAVYQGYRAVYNVNSACTVRMSFAKGWGADYRRQRVTECNSWVEIHLNGPFQWLDRVLSTMPSTEQTGSGT